MKINVGCGEYPISGHINIDMFSDAADVRGDFLDMGTRWHDVEHVEMSHILEHVPWRLTVSALRLVRGWLRPGGTARIEVPDMVALSARGVGYFGWEHLWFGAQTNPGEFHYTGFSEETLRRYLTEAGFEITAMRRFDSDHRERVGYPCLEAWVRRPEDEG